jgi:uncharacterized membrane protein YeiH
LLRPEIYITAAIAGAAVYTIADLFLLPDGASALIAFAAAFIVRGGALKFGWSVPTYKSRPGRHPNDIP